MLYTRSQSGTLSCQWLVYFVQCGLFIKFTLFLDFLLMIKFMDCSIFRHLSCIDDIALAPRTLLVACQPRMSYSSCSSNIACGMLAQDELHTFGISVGLLGCTECDPTCSKKTCQILQISFYFLYFFCFGDIFQAQIKINL